MRSGNRGATWETVALPAELIGTLDDGYIGIDYVNPDTLYLGARDLGLWRSTDGGVTWIKRHPLDTGPITVSLDDPATLWAGNWDTVYRPLARSTDGGLIWGTASQGIAVQSSPISPILVDPQAHNVLYSLFMGNRGLADLYRSSDGFWETLPAPINDLPLGWTSPGLMMDGSTRGLYVGSPDGTLSVSFNAFTPVRGEVAWQTVQTFSYQPVPLAVGAGPAGSALYITLRDQGVGSIDPRPRDAQRRRRRHLDPHHDPAARRRAADGHPDADSHAGLRAEPAADARAAVGRSGDIADIAAVADAEGVPGPRARDHRIQRSRRYHRQRHVLVHNACVGHDPAVAHTYTTCSCRAGWNTAPAATTRSAPAPIGSARRSSSCNRGRLHTDPDRYADPHCNPHGHPAVHHAIGVLRGPDQRRFRDEHRLDHPLEPGAGSLRDHACA